MGDGFYRSKDPTNSKKVLKEQIVHRQMLIFPAIILNRRLLIIIWYFWPRPWPQPPEIGLGFGLVTLASASRFWPRLTSLVTM